MDRPDDSPNAAPRGRFRRWLGVVGLLAIAGLALPLAAQSPGTDASAPRAGDVGAPPSAEREHWLAVLRDRAASADADIARSARAALAELDRGPRDRAGFRAGEGRPPRPPFARGAHRDRADGEFGRGNRAQLDDRRANGARGPGDRRPPACGPGCCLHGAGRFDGPPPPRDHPPDFGPPRGERPFPPPGGRGAPPPFEPPFEPPFAPHGARPSDAPPPRDTEHD